METPGQVAALALPLRFAWGDNYSKGTVNQIKMVL